MSERPGYGGLAHRWNGLDREGLGDRGQARHLRLEGIEGIGPACYRHHAKARRGETTHDRLPEGASGADNHCQLLLRARICLHHPNLLKSLHH